jgi:hypothetical protein
LESGVLFKRKCCRSDLGISAVRDVAIAQDSPVTLGALTDISLRRYSAVAEPHDKKNRPVFRLRDTSKHSRQREPLTPRRHFATCGRHNLKG